MKRHTETSGKSLRRVCKTFIQRFKSARRLHKQSKELVKLTSSFFYSEPPTSFQKSATSARIFSETSSVTFESYQSAGIDPA
ncbi:hypothetical protein SAMN06269301_0961 [Geobacter sp. DSM 9736]|nr:hypothetical protein SAMN06269301_0961 [Geobacter sp. DSM 9736]